MSQLRIALVRQRYTAFGGAERFLERLLATLGGRAALTLLTRRWDGQARGDFHTVALRPFHLGRLWRDWGFARAVRAHLAENSYDLVQSHERISGCDLYRAGDGVHARWLSQRARVLGPLARAAQMLSPWHRYTLAAERALFESPALKAVICNSPMVREEIRARFAIDPAKLRLVYNGIDTDSYHPRLRAHRVELRARLGIPEHAFVWLFVGSGFERKGLESALRATARGGNYLLVVGKDKRQRRYEKLAARLGIARRARFAGPQRDVKPFYGAADGLVLPALYEPFGNVVLEALACGLPVITSDGNGAACLIDETNGAVCDALDSAAIADAMAALAAPARQAALQAAARATAEPFTLEATGAAMTRLYRELLGLAEAAPQPQMAADEHAHD